MTKFTTRIELFDTNDGTSEEYETLHLEMKRRGFSRTIISDEGIEYHLPPAEYNLINNNLTGEQVRTLAAEAAKQTKKDFSILVTPSKGRYWIGLRAVKK